MYVSTRDVTPPLTITADGYDHRSSIIEWQYKKTQSMEKERLAFFYCSRKKEEKTTSFEVLCSLLAQLARIDNGISISPLVRNMYDKREMNPIKIQGCSDLLADLIKEYRRTIFIIDALDECEDADTLLLHLKHLYDNIPNARNLIKIFFSSRYNIDVAEYFSDCEKLELETCRYLKYDDMKFYIETQIKDRKTLLLGSRLLKGKYPELENRLIDVLLKNSRGM